MTTLRDHWWHVCYEQALGFGLLGSRAEEMADVASRQRYAGFDPQQPRDEEGQWIEAGGYHVQVDKEGIIRKGGHVGLHGRHHTEAEGFVPPAKPAAPQVPSAPQTSIAPATASDEQIKKRRIRELDLELGNWPTPERKKQVEAELAELGALQPGGPDSAFVRSLMSLPEVLVGQPSKKGMPSPDDLAKSLGQPAAQTAGDGPLAGMSNEQAIAEILKRTKIPVGGAMAQGAEGNPLGYDLTPGDSPVAQQVLQAAVAQQQTNPFARLTIPQMYEQFGKGMTPFQFQQELVKAHKAGKLHLGAFTQALAGIPDVKQAIPLDREMRWYVEPPRSGVAKHENPEQPDRYLDGRAMRQHHGKSVEHAVARLQALADREDDADEEEIEGTINGIARQFSAAQLKEVALAMGIRGSTKGILIQRIIDQLIEKGE